MEIKTFADLIDWTRQLHAHVPLTLPCAFYKDANSTPSYH